MTDILAFLPYFSISFQSFPKKILVSIHLTNNGGYFVQAKGTILNKTQPFPQRVPTLMEGL